MAPFKNNQQGPNVDSSRNEKYYLAKIPGKPDKACYLRHQAAGNLAHFGSYSGFNEEMPKFVLISIF